MCTTQQVILITTYLKKILQGSRLLKHVFALLARFTIAIRYNGFKSRNFCTNISLVQKLDQKATCTTKNKASFSLSNLESPRLTKNIKIYIPNVFLIQSFMGTFTVNPKQNDYLNNERDANNGKQVKINGEQHPASGKRGKWHHFQNGRSLQI